MARNANPKPLDDLGYLDQAKALLERIRIEQADNIRAAGAIMADAIADDRLIHVYGGGGHTTLVMGEMFFRAGGLSNVNPIMETGLSVFNQARKYLELERCVNFGTAVVRYYDIRPGDPFIIFHNIGINAATIDAALEAKRKGARIIAVSSSHWQREMPPEHTIRHPSKANLFDLAEVCIDDFNPVGDAVVEVPGLAARIAPISNLIDFTIAHWLEIACVKECVARGLKPPVWSSANAPGGDERNADLLARYSPRIKSL